MKAFNLPTTLTDMLTAENTTFHNLFGRSGSIKLPGNVQKVMLEAYSQNHQPGTPFVCDTPPSFPSVPFPCSAAACFCCSAASGAGPW